MVTVFGWWRLTLFDKERSGPRWACIGPIAMGLIALSSFVLMNTDGATWNWSCGRCSARSASASARK